jgi:[glutamine synthetase] adenylyltransferase / [glutamine synthetase]-adenylyl-L-tyrosine phosphorylase
MRRRIAKEHPAETIWSVKYADGGLIDLDFMAQYLQLRHAADKPEVLAISTQQAFANLAAAGLLDAARAERLIAATRFLRQVQEALRLTVGPAFDADSLSAPLKAALATSIGCDDFDSLRSRLEETLAWAHGVYLEVVDAPAPAGGEEAAEGVLPFAKGA